MRREQTDRLLFVGLSAAFKLDLMEAERGSRSGWARPGLWVALGMTWRQGQQSAAATAEVAVNGGNKLSLQPWKTDHSGP